jgi:hypothetical protein
MAEYSKFVSPVEPDVYPPPLKQFNFTAEVVAYLAEHGIVEMWPGGPFKNINDGERTSDLFVDPRDDLNNGSYHDE